MEVAENAQFHEAAEWEARNRRPPDRPKFQPGDAGYGPEACDECEDVMPLLRREMGCELCTPCTSALERQQARQGRRYRP